MRNLEKALFHYSCLTCFVFFLLFCFLICLYFSLFIFTFPHNHPRRTPSPLQHAQEFERSEAVAWCSFESRALLRTRPVCVAVLRGTSAIARWQRYVAALEANQQQQHQQEDRLNGSLPALIDLRLLGHITVPNELTTGHGKGTATTGGNGASPEWSALFAASDRLTAMHHIAFFFDPPVRRTDWLRVLCFFLSLS